MNKTFIARFRPTVNTKNRPTPKLQPRKGAPRLWNAKRRIKTSFARVPTKAGDGIRREASEDVLAFVQKAREMHQPLLPEQEKACLHRPVQFFSRPGNVRPELRKQVYLPDVVVTMTRTSHLGPRYAAFDVPLTFTKLDIKDFLKSVYNVDILHVRSTVIHGRVKRKQGAHPNSRGRLYRERSTKRMTVQLVKPFVWPEAVTDFSAWEKDQFWEAQKANFQQQMQDSDWGKQNPNDRHRRSIAEQAKALLSGKATWSPTWQQIPSDVRVMQGESSSPR